MKVSIGNYPNWIGPYQFVDKIGKWLGLSDKTMDWIAERLPSKPFDYIHSLKKHKIKVHIDKWDTWSLDYTLALIILPALKEFKTRQHGAGHTDDEDVPDHLKSTAPGAIIDKNDGTDDKFYARWDWILDEMIFAFENKADSSWENDPSPENYKAMSKRISNGFRLFGKYYNSLWD